MKTTVKFLSLIVMAFALTMGSCSPEDGEDGMDGAMGEQGIAGMDGQDGTDGQDGADGQDGQDGEDGNANVFSSGWVEYDEAVWTEVTGEFGIDYRNYPIEEAEITQDIVDNGVVLVYNRFVITGTHVYTLPFTENITSNDPNGQTISYQFEVNELVLKMRNASGSGDPGTFGGPGIAEFRYIVIPSTNGGRPFNLETLTADLAAKGVNINNYNEVLAYYQL